MFRPRHLDVREQVLVSLSWDWCGDQPCQPFNCVYRVVNLDCAHVAVWRHGSHCEEERAAQGDGIVNEARRLLRKDIGRIVPFPADGSITVALGCYIQILIRVWVQEKVGTGPACGERRVVVVGSMEVEQLARVEGAVATRLEPDREIVFIVAFGNELWIAA